MSEKETRSAYKDLLVWQRGMEFASAMIDLVDKLQTPRKHYRLIEQLEACAASVPMNIAEGKGRRTAKEFVHFLYIARGSLYESMTLLALFEMRGWITRQEYESLEAQSDQIAKMLHGLIASIRSS